MNQCGADIELRAVMGSESDHNRTESQRHTGNYGKAQFWM